MVQRKLRFAFIRWLFFIFGIFLIGLGIALMVRGAFGLSPWDVFHQGVTKNTPWSMGRVMQGTGIALILISWILGYRPGLGTIINMWGVGYFFDLTLPYLPEINHLGFQILFFLGGVLVYGWGTGVYIACDLGAGPRDSLMMALHQRTGQKISLMRTGIEIFALISGWCLGGLVGLGTIIFSVTIGPLVAWFLDKMEALMGKLKDYFGLREEQFSLLEKS